MFVTYIDTQTGESKTGSLREISKQLNIPEFRLKNYRRQNIRQFGTIIVSFNWQYIKQPRKGTKENFLQYRNNPSKLQS